MIVATAPASETTLITDSPASDVRVPFIVDTLAPDLQFKLREF